MIPTLSARDEARILGALEKLAEDESADVDPDAALAKAASEAGLPAGHVNILVRAYNNSRATWQRESGRDLYEKAAGHPLADEAAVIARLYPARPDTPAELERRAGVSDEYRHAPHWYGDPAAEARAARALELLARPVAGKAAAAPPAADPADAFRAAHKRARSAQQRLEADHLALAGAVAKAVGAVRKLAAAMGAYGAPAWPDVRENAGLLHGEAGLAVMDEAARRAPAALAKRASSDPYHRVGAHPAIYGALAEAVAAGSALVAAEAEFAGLRKAAEAEVLAALGPYVEAPAPEKVAGDLSDLLMPEPKEAGVGRDVGKAFAVTELRDMVERMSKTLPTGDRDGAVNKALGRLNDPMHEARLRDLETQFMLQDLLLNDPVISGHDPHQVAATMNEFSQIAPHYASKPLLMRPQLRRALEVGGPDTFEAHEALGAEHRLRELNQVPQPPMGGPANAAAGRAPAR